MRADGRDEIANHCCLMAHRDRVQSKDYIGPVKKLAHRQKKNLLTEVVKKLLTIKIKFCLPYRLKKFLPH